MALDDHQSGSELDPYAYSSDFMNRILANMGGLAPDRLSIGLSDQCSSSQKEDPAPIRPTPGPRP